VFSAPRKTSGIFNSFHECKQEIAGTYFMRFFTFFVILLLNERNRK